MLTTILDILTAITAIIAAFVWFKSAIVKTPNNFSIHIINPNASFGNPMGGNPLGGSYVGNAYSKDLQDLADALNKQSKQSALAACFAGASAILQAISILIKVFCLNLK